MSRHTLQLPIIKSWRYSKKINKISFKKLGVSHMGKEQKKRKDVKKKAQKTAKEKRAEKKIKKNSR